MCGILGHIPSCNEQEFEYALGKLQHRGPDGFGIWSDEIITLGHRRLSILDLSENGKQPMHYLHYAITFNGEIYNFIELREKLRKRGYAFATESDTEVLVAAYDCFGEACVHDMNGMWAFAIWDKNKKELFLSRDRFGKKPLFYSIIGGKFIFASEMKAIFPFLNEVKPSTDFDWCKQNVFSYESTDKCLIQGIKRFPAGCSGYYSSSQLTLRKYWDTRDHLEEIRGTYGEQVEKFRELFLDACKIRMRSDVSIGTALSGGLDSSATICSMSHIGKLNPESRVSKDWQHAFVASFPDSTLDESIFAKKVTDYLNINATVLPIDPHRGFERLLNYQYLFEELYITSPVPMMDLYAEVKRNGISVTIDGHGADELLSGYGKDIYRAFLDCGLNIPKIKNILDTYRFLRRVDLVQVPTESHSIAQYLKYMNTALGGRTGMMRFYVKDLLGMRKQERPQNGSFGVFNNHLFEIFHATILPTLLRNYDRYAMASGVEIRMPFMDHRVVSFLFSLPWESKLRGGYTKTIVRDALKDIMPEEIVWRKMKIGFNTPIVDWIKGDWREFLLDEISSISFKNCDLIDHDKVRTKILAVMNNAKAPFSAGEEAWSGLTPYFWEKAVIKSVYQNQ